jgi:hypothetical protein
MAEVFEQIMQGGYFVPFGNCSASQLECKEFTAAHLQELLSARQREKFMKEIRVCVCGYGPADEDEEMEEGNFSQYQFFRPYHEDLVFFVDKFDFIICCVAHGVCRVQAGFEHRMMCALLSVLTHKHCTVPSAPDHVLDLRQPVTPRTVAEQHRSEEQQAEEFTSYVTRRRSFSNAIKEELKQLEAEQFEVEKARGEHPTLMGWT